MNQYKNVKENETINNMTMNFLHNFRKLQQNVNFLFKKMSFQRFVRKIILNFMKNVYFQTLIIKTF